MENQHLRKGEVFQVDHPGVSLELEHPMKFSIPEKRLILSALQLATAYREDLRGGYPAGEQQEREDEILRRYRRIATGRAEAIEKSEIPTVRLAVDDALDSEMAWIDAHKACDDATTRQTRRSTERNIARLRRFRNRRFGDRRTVLENFLTDAPAIPVSEIFKAMKEKSLQPSPLDSAPDDYLVTNWTPGPVLLRVQRVEDDRWLHTAHGIFDAKNKEWLKSGSVKILRRGTKRECQDFILADLAARAGKS